MNYSEAQSLLSESNFVEHDLMVIVTRSTRRYAAMQNQRSMPTKLFEAGERALG